MQDPNDNFVEELIRRRLIEEAATAIHSIQSDFDRERNAFVSWKLGENLYSVIEAIFLHGLRPNSWASKFSSALGISKNSVVENTNFLDLVSGISHRDVLQRITALSQTTSQVGRCRAWMRLAFNDGLLQSYLIAITNNVELNESYYQTWAFLRDRESVDIVHNHLLGLQHFAFKLELDRAELNRWDRRTLIMAGLIPDPNHSPTQPDKMTPVMTEISAPSNASRVSAEQEPEISPTEDLMVIHTRGRPTRPARPTSAQKQILVSILADSESAEPAVIPPIHHNIDTLEGPDSELNAYMRIKVSPEENDSQSDVELIQNDAGTSTSPLPISSLSATKLLGDDLLEESFSSGHSGNLLARNTGWSSPYEDSVDTPIRKLRSDTRERFDLVFERGAASSTANAFPNSLGIGSPLFATMVDGIQSASSTTTGNLSNSGTLSTDGDHDFEMLDTKDISRCLEGKKGEFLLRIPVEKGMRAQHYKCGGCSRALTLGPGKGRLCNFDKIYYCLDCHLNDESVIPSRLIHNWDFRKYKVSTRARELIETIESTPLFNMKELNPKLYIHIKLMEEAQSARVQLQVVKSYLWTCKKDICELFNQRLWPHDHLHESLHMYSLSDLLLVYNGQLVGKMKSATQFGIDHIRKCFLCSQRGFICEVCRAGQVLHAFDTKDNYQCLKCFAVFHKKCMNATKSCPKCQRKQRHAQRISQLSSH